MSADYNGWRDQRVTERESIEIWEASTTAFLTPVMLYRIASNVSLSRARSAYDVAGGGYWPTPSHPPRVGD